MNITPDAEPVINEPSSLSEFHLPATDSNQLVAPLTQDSTEQTDAEWGAELSMILEEIDSFIDEVFKIWEDADDVDSAIKAVKDTGTRHIETANGWFDLTATYIDLVGGQGQSGNTESYSK